MLCDGLSGQGLSITWVPDHSHSGGSLTECAWTGPARELLAS